MPRYRRFIYRRNWLLLPFCIAVEVTEVIETHPTHSILRGKVTMYYTRKYIVIVEERMVSRGLCICVQNKSPKTTLTV